MEVEAGLTEKIINSVLHMVSAPETFKRKRRRGNRVCKSETQREALARDRNTKVTGMQAVNEAMGVDSTGGCIGEVSLGSGPEEALMAG